MTGRAAWIFGGFLMIIGGCDEDIVDADVDDGAIALRGLGDNGWSLNGWSLNGWSLNGWSLNGDAGTSDYIQAVDFSHDNKKVSQLWLEGSELVLELKNGPIVRGAAVHELKIKYEMHDAGKKHKKTIWVRNAAESAPGSGVWFYDVELKETGDYVPLCTDGAGNATQAVLLGGVWNPETGDRRAVTVPTLTYACRGAALAKCVEWGYKPWTQAGGTSLYDFHQTCTRMVRADYCGEGLPHTVNGTPIHVLDQLGVQNVDPGVTYAVEAEWGPNGALCLNSGNTRLPGQTIECSLPACGAAFASGGLIQSGKVLGGP